MQYSITESTIPTGWFHGTFILNGLTAGISLYIDGALAQSSSSWNSFTGVDPLGDVALGKKYTEQDSKYADVTVDELCYWREALTDHQVELVYNWY